MFSILCTACLPVLTALTAEFPPTIKFFPPNSVSIAKIMSYIRGQKLVVIKHKVKLNFSNFPIGTFSFSQNQSFAETKKCFVGSSDPILFALFCVSLLLFCSLAIYNQFIKLIASSHPNNPRES